MIFISSSGTFKRFSICNYDRSKRCWSFRKITEDEAFGLNDLIEDCEELKVLQIEKWSIIGHSFGGYVALLYASIYPSSIEIIFEG